MDKIIKNRVEYFMKITLKLVKEAFNEDESPVGTVAVKDCEIISTGRNRG